MTTTNLGLTLPTVGADSDAWGTELNTALTVVDTAFSPTGGPSLGITKLGVGVAPTDQFNVQKDQNSITIARVKNGTSGTAASAGWRVTNDSSDDFTLSNLCSGYTTSGLFSARRSVLSTNGSGIAITTLTAQPILFGVNNIQVAAFAADGTFLLKVLTVSGLPTGQQGARAFVSDATSSTFATIVSGGGTNPVPVYHDGTNWRIG